MPETDRGLSAIDGFAIGLTDPRPKVALPGDSAYITNVQPRVIIDVAGCLVKFYRHWDNLF